MRDDAGCPAHVDCLLIYMRWLQFYMLVSLTTSQGQGYLEVLIFDMIQIARTKTSSTFLRTSKFCDCDITCLRVFPCFPAAPNKVIMMRKVLLWYRFSLYSSSSSRRRSHRWCGDVFRLWCSLLFRLLYSFLLSFDFYGIRDGWNITTFQYDQCGKKDGDLTNLST